jgi:hypothetical protein
MENITVTFKFQDLAKSIELTDAQAWELGQFLKRLSFSQCRELAEDDNAAYRMIEATEELRTGLAGVGYSPR